MTGAARIWDNTSGFGASSRDAGDRSVRHQQYERILGQIATGVFILEPAQPDDPNSLEITFVNEMGANFFGRATSSVPQVLADAGH